MAVIKRLLNRVVPFFHFDCAPLFDAERRREEAFLAEASSLSELEARQRAWDRRSGAAFPL